MTMTTVLYIYVAGMAVAFAAGCLLAGYYEYVRKERQQWEYIATLSILSWVSVVLIAVNYKKPFVHLYRILRRRFGRFVHRVLRR